ncbi:unnamed protein product [Polarella glacialis]|uniref:Ornithine aminotransferase n=1 Tax=Polarella glacialis TaxID=89957 RepID=A0A813JFI4_POLGL|nr:unnamed protein product [Polarella glacialis]
MNISSTQDAVIKREEQYGSHNYHPLPVVLKKGEGVHVWDLDGKRYYDFLSAYSAVNQGHCHPKIIAALVEQAQTLTLTSRAFHNNLLGEYAKFITEFFGFDRLLPMNTGVEGGETAIKLARRWGYDAKGITPGKARVVFAKGNFWGRTIAAISTSDDSSSTGGFGPLCPGFNNVPYDDSEALKAELEGPGGEDICAFFVEPIQGEAGVVVPSDGYLRRVKDLCEKHKILFICDEVQTGLARCGTMLASDHDGVKPDLLVPGEHGSTYGGIPLACKVATAALEAWWRTPKPGSPISLARGRGLLNAIVIGGNGGNYSEEGVAWQLCERIAENGPLAKPTHGNIIRFAPPLIITAPQIDDCVRIIERSIDSLWDTPMNFLSYYFY